MKAILLAAALLTGCAARPAPPTARDTFSEAIRILSTTPLNHERVDWVKVRAELEPTFQGDGPPAAAHGAIAQAVTRLNDKHARFMPPPPPAAPTTHSAPPTSNPGATKPAEPAARQVPNVPSGRMLDGRIAYVVVPMCQAPDVDSLRVYAGTLRKAILELDEQRPAAWLIELRFNGGGNVWPMLAGLRPLLGDGVQFTSVLNKDVTQKFGCDAASAWLEEGGTRMGQLSVDPPAGDRLIPNPKVAVLTGPWTMSSGECIALAFRGRARSFGDLTAGLTTVTNFYPLADGSMLNLPVYLMADREGRAPGGAIPPDVSVECKDWPTPEDPQARAAREWAAGR